MQIGRSGFSFVKRVPAYKVAEAWNQTRRNANARYQTDNKATSDALLGVQQSVSEGRATLAAQAAILRAQAELKAKQAQTPTSAPVETFPNYTRNIDRIIAGIEDLVDGSSSGGSTIQAGGATIDLDADRITLSNGDVLDIKTGQKVNVTA